MASDILTKKPLSRLERSIAVKYRKMLQAQARAAGQYELADRLAYAIAEELGGHGKSIRIATDGRGIEVIDNYQAAIAHPKRAPNEMPKAWAHGSVRQFGFKEVTLFSK